MGHLYIDGLVQHCINSITNALELLRSCIYPSICKGSEVVHIAMVMTWSAAFAGGKISSLPYDIHECAAIMRCFGMVMPPFTLRSICWIMCFPGKYGKYGIHSKKKTMLNYSGTAIGESDAKLFCEIFRIDLYRMSIVRHANKTNLQKLLWKCILCISRWRSI